MLVLSRKKNEKIILVVGEETIEVTIVRIEPQKVRVGVKAGDNVKIMRSELLDQDNNSLIEPVPE